MLSLTPLFVLLGLKLLFCLGCLRSPTVESGPTIPISTMTIITSTATTTTTMNPNPCFGSFTAGPGVVITSETMDASGVYMITLACTNGGILRVNGENVSIPNLRCGADGRYTYFGMAGVTGPANTVTCMP